jgi:hypothetical protein
MKYFIVFASLLILSRAGSLSESLSEVKGVFETNECLQNKF